jgi:hypothetical protein
MTLTLWLREGRKERPGRHRRCSPIRDAVEDGGAKKMKKAHDFKFSRNRPLHSCYDVGGGGGRECKNTYTC